MVLNLRNDVAPFNTGLHVMVIQLFLLLLQNYNFAHVVNCNLNVCVFQWSFVTPVKESFHLLKES